MGWKRLDLIGAVALSVSLLPLGCGERQPEPPPEPAKSEEQLRQEAEAARRQEATAALAERAAQLTAAAEELRAKVSAEDGLPTRLEGQLGELAEAVGESQRLVAELQQAGGQSWEEAQQRLEGALGELDAARDRATGAVGDWQRRVAEALAAKGEGVSPVNPKSGLIEGLDGGQYEQYLVSVVEQVQRRLRQEGHYAGPVDGDFDRVTLEAVGAYQQAHELQVSGVPSPRTRGRLFDGGG